MIIFALQQQCKHLQHRVLISVDRIIPIQIIMRMKMMTMNKIFILLHHHVCILKKTLNQQREIMSFLIKATPRDPSPSLFSHSNNPEQHRIYNQAVLLNSLIRNMMNDSNIQNSSSNESCFSTDTQVNDSRTLNST